MQNGNYKIRVVHCCRFNHILTMLFIFHFQVWQTAIACYCGSFEGAAVCISCFQRLHKSTRTSAVSSGYSAALLRKLHCTKHAPAAGGRRPRFRLLIVWSLVGFTSGANCKPLPTLCVTSVLNSRPSERAPVRGVLGRRSYTPNDTTRASVQTNTHRLRF